MKLLLNLIFAGVTTAASIHSTTGANEPINTVIHRMLQQGCKDDFQCPQNSRRKPGRSCYDSFQDCDCDPGYRRTSRACVAEEGLCNLNYLNMVENEQEDVEFWIGQAENARDPEEKYRYVEKANDVLSGAWKDYNKGKASCEMYVFDDGDGEGRKLRCCSRLRRAVKKIADGFKKVVKKVVDVVVKVVDTVVDVVTELVECGVGIATDGLKCGLIGCAFGLFGVAADIAFTLATGGVNKAVAATCDIAELAQQDDDDSNCTTQQCRNAARKKKKQNALVSLLIGAGDAVCAVNKKIESSMLGKVCDFAEDARGSKELGLETGITEQLVQNKVVLRFIEAFKTLMCGNPGSALTEILEEVVSCETGCAESNNVFCPATIERTTSSTTPKPITTGSTTPRPSKDDKYNSKNGRSCRRRDAGNDQKGVSGIDYDLRKGTSFNICKNKCSGRGNGCRGFEWRSDGRCELWLKKIDFTVPGDEPKGRPHCWVKSNPTSEIEYRKHGGKACRTDKGGNGVAGRDFTLIKDTSAERCEQLCSNNTKCNGWEYNENSSRCEIWESKPKQFDVKSGFDCFVKKQGS
eukprot:CAMPEP_0197432702 /NCGR_PEP_ID=MMETSP1175-20131217/730_1 /TAXON_ID=1003142 /ORGANISM="Triceratium dubium, Strain CCMP147" /LENGTH=577 /DNA_ID=CAMNT_0042960857 /DNA_START=43 /DNA_END=1776 /DNA_ORIENTATION=+